ncbi:MAG: hypothetical protein IKR13_03330 [Victivallales bacterium]|nr:hypothetical protein [Victivallales bacterium]
MRIKVALLLLCGFVSLSTFAHGPGAIPLVPPNEGGDLWTPLQLGIWPVQLFDPLTSIYGLNSNLLLAIQDKEVYGISVAPFHVCGDDVAGITIGLDSIIEGDHSGILISLVSGVGNNYGIQAGVLNVCKDNHYGHAHGHCGGLQIGLVNVSDAPGVQIGLYNHSNAPEDSDWQRWRQIQVQVGLFNHSNAPGLQIGVVNHNSNASVEWLPLVNFLF